MRRVLIRAAQPQTGENDVITNQVIRSQSRRVEKSLIRGEVVTAVLEVKHPIRTSIPR
jgi:hypothetical protein